MPIVDVKQALSSDQGVCLIQQNISLADKNWFGTGGTSTWYAEPTTAHEFQYALQFAQKHHAPIFILGHGANILISDQGFNGLTIRPQLITISAQPATPDTALVTAGAGVSFENLIQFCFKNNYVGLHEFSGIPGTVGGSVYINIHYFEYLLSNFLVSATIIHRTTGNLLTIDNAWFNFGYNQSTLQQHEYFIVDATFKVQKVTDLACAYAQGRHDEMVRYRGRRYPQSGTCGSFFRNFFEHEVTQENAGRKMIYVAYYLDKLGIKGQLSVGGAVVSHQHANMIFNTGNATSHDIITLARTMQKMVHDNFGILPQPECQLIGFTNNPLL